MTNQLMKPFFSGLSELHQALDRLFDRDFYDAEKNFPAIHMTHWTPKIDVKDKDNRYLIRADIPGVNSKDIELNFKNGILTINGKKESETKEEKSNYRQIERFSGVFYREISLPDAADSKKIDAKYKNGVLEIMIPKSDKSATHRIEIKES